MGGWTERDVSLCTGEAVAGALERRGHDVVRIVCGVGDRDLHESLRSARPDAVFVALHGRGGEDGCVQGALELLGIPYTGSGVLASALAMDKLKAKEMFRLHNVATPPYYVVGAGERGDLETLHGSFGFPAIVKPRREGSSVGLAKVGSLLELADAVGRALSHDDDVLVERFIRAMEVTVGFLDGRALGALEVVPRGGLYDHSAKYTAGLSEYFSPPRLPETRLRGVVNLATSAVRALSCVGPCRVDLLVTEGQNEYVLEVNTLPGMTATSLLPKIAASTGLDYGSLCEAILAGARLHASLPGVRTRASQPQPRRRPPQRSGVAFDGGDGRREERNEGNERNERNERNETVSPPKAAAG